MDIKILIKKLALFKEKVRTDDLTRHGSMMIAFSLLVHFLNYLYQLSMSLLLTPAQYGTLFSLTSLFAITIIFSHTFRISTAKFVSKLKTEAKWDRINWLWRHSLKRTLLLGSVIFVTMALLTPLISRFLNIENNWYALVLFSTFMLAFALPVNWGMLQGLQRFLPLGFSQTLWALFKLVVGVILVYLGFGLYGGLVAYIVAYIMAFIVTLFLLKDLSRRSNEKFEVSALTSYTSLAFLAIFSFAVLTNIDIVLVKHYLSPENAGNYSSISILGKVALYAPTGIALAMFPKTSGLFEIGVTTRSILKKALLFVFLISGSIVVVYWFFSDFIVKLLYGDRYPFITPYVLKYGLAMALFALSFLLMNYLLSLNQTKIAYFFLVAMILELTLIVLFHSSIAQIVNIMLISATFCVILTIPLLAKVRHK